MKKIIIDTDPGIGALGADIDDGLAIVMALNSPELKVLGLTVVNGNVDSRTGLINALNLLEVMERPEIPVCLGMDRPLLGDMAFVRETLDSIMKRSGWTEGAEVKAKNVRLKPKSQHAIDFIIEQARQYPGEITLCCIGPLSNLAMAIRKCPELPSLLKDAIIMGGGWTQPLDCMTPVAEFNMYCDPEAAKIVFHSGLELSLTGYDLCKKTQLHPRHLEVIREHGTKTSAFIYEMAKPWLAFMNAAFGADYCFLPDPQAIALAIDPGLFTIEPMYLDIEIKSELTRAMIVADRNQALPECPHPPNVKVCTDIDVPVFMDLLLARLR